MIEVQTYADGNVKLRAFGEFSCTSAVSLRHIVDDSIGHGLHLTIDLGGVATFLRRLVSRVGTAGYSGNYPADR